MTSSECFDLRIIWHAKHYTGRGVMKFYPTGEDLAKDMGVPLQTLIDTHQKHFEAAKKQEQYGEIWKNGLLFVNVYQANSCFKRRL